MFKAEKGFGPDREGSRNVAVVLVAGIVLAALVIVTAVVTLGSGAASGSPTSGPVAVAPPPAIALPPELDDFYKSDPASLAHARNGKILKARRINPAIYVFVSLNVDAWQLEYRTTDVRGVPVANVTTVLKPRGAAPAGGRKLLSYSVAEDSGAQYCGPGWALQYGGFPLNSPASQLEPIIPIASGLSQGWTVSIPDYEGPHSNFGASVAQAHSILDAARAVQDFAPAQTAGRTTRTAFWGYSGGSLGPSKAAEIRGQYAPDINVAGIAVGGIAAANMEASVRHNNGGTYAGLVASAFVGMATEYPDMRRELDDHMDLLGKVVLATKPYSCLQWGTAVFPFYNYLGSMSVDPFTLPGIKHAVTESSLGSAPTPRVPEYFYQAVYDELVPTWTVDNIYKKYCAAGHPSLTYNRETLGEHMSSGALTGVPDAFFWIRDRLNGRPAAAGCHTVDEFSNIQDPTFARALGIILPTILDGILQRPIGQR